MNNKKHLIFEVTLGILLTGFLSWAYLSKSSFTENIRFVFDDFFFKFNIEPSGSENIHLVEIDAKSIGDYGRWPWSRTRQAELIDNTVAYGAKVIGVSIILEDQEKMAGIEEVELLKNKFSQEYNRIKPQLQRKGISTKGLDGLSNEFDISLFNFDGDAILSQTIEQASNVILPMYFEEGPVLGKTPELPEYASSDLLKIKPDPQATEFWLQVKDPHLPIPILGSAVVGLGHINLPPDKDGRVRQINPVVQYGSAYFPSFGLQIVREYLDLPREAITFENSQLVLNKAQIPLDENGQIYIDFVRDHEKFKRVSARDVIKENLPPGIFENQIVLISCVVPGYGEIFTGPGGERYTSLDVWASHIANVLNQEFIQRPPWAFLAELGIIIVAGIIIIGVLPFVRARFAIPVSLTIFILFIGTSLFFLITKSLFFSPSYGIMILLSGFIVLVAKRLLLTEKGKEMVEAEGVETNKMLGLSFQGQGMLDLAFEKFRKCPMDKSMKELLYNLGLDMERKRQFSKAAAVYEHIAANDPKFKDIQQKIEMLKKASDGAVFGGVGKRGSDSTVVVEGLGQFTTLGRYEVVKELGRGAMGIVYLGKDPKINRQVAIKTLRFEDEADEEQTKSIKERFFREAESAGSLTHPNIIRIFDAGEDQEVAYIAMELLNGVDLKKFCDKSHLLPIPRVLEIVSQIADALDYAHLQGVVHRDIKPGNIMMLKDDTLRITDFGIARIQAASKTATGAVLGTPAYMSPEQVNGQKVDGRADIFSLGVTLFELLTGEKPFAADTIAALLYRIANVEHTDPREYKPNISERVVAILKKALAKDPKNRYQRALEMAEDLRLAMGELGGIKSPPKQQSSNQESTTKQIDEIKTVGEPEKETTDKPENGSPPSPETMMGNQTESDQSEKTTKEEKSTPSMYAIADSKTMSGTDSNSSKAGGDFLSELERTFNVKSNGDSEEKAPPPPDVPAANINQSSNQQDATISDAGQSSAFLLDQPIEQINGLEQTKISNEDDSGSEEIPRIDGLESNSSSDEESEKS